MACLDPQQEIQDLRPEITVLLLKSQNSLEEIEKILLRNLAGVMLISSCSSTSLNPEQIYSHVPCPIIVLKDDKLFTTFCGAPENIPSVTITPHLGGMCI